MAGYTRTPGQAINVKLKDGVKLEYSGMVISLDSNGEGILATATSTPYGIALNSTMDVQKFNLVGRKVFKTGGQISVVRGGQIRMALAKAHGNITKGVEMKVSATAADIGRVGPTAAISTIDTVAKVVTEMDRQKLIVGIAEETLASGNTDGRYVLVSLRIQQGLTP